MIYGSHTVDYHQLILLGNVQGITAFKDRGDYDAPSERSTPTRSRRDVQTPNEQNAFKEIELKENKTAQNRAPMSSSGHQKKKSVFRDSNENLPYTEFEGLSLGLSFFCRTEKLNFVVKLEILVSLSL